MRKVQFEVGKYTVKEGPTGGWSVRVTGAEQPISVHETRREAHAAAHTYDAADKRRAT